MARINRRKPRNNKGITPRVSKTPRRELCPTQRAFAVGAIVMGNASQYKVAKEMGISQGGLSMLLARTKEKAAASGLPIWDPVLYENDLGRGRPELLSQAQKDAIVRITTQDREHREEEPWQALAHGNFKDLGLPEISCSTFQNVMYEAGYARRAPGFKPTLNQDQKNARYQWALSHNPDKNKVGDNLGFNFRKVIFTDETPARVGEQRGMKRAWAKEDETYHKDVKRPKIQANYCTLQFYGSFTFNHKGPCHIFGKETMNQKVAAQKALDQENAQNQAQREMLIPIARRALRSMGDPEGNSRRKAWRKDMAHVRGDRTRGGVDGYRHREEVLKPLLVPWIRSLQEEGLNPILLEDGAPSHTSKIATEFLQVSAITKLEWPGHSPDINAHEHAWPWIRRHITKDFSPSTCEAECRQHWEYEWDQLPIEVINKWIDSIPGVVREIIKHGGNNDFHEG